MLVGTSFEGMRVLALSLAVAGSVQVLFSGAKM